MDRRAFSFSFAGISLAPAALAHAGTKPSKERGESALSNLSTFTQVGKEEQPFLAGTEATLAEKSGKGYLDHMWFGGGFPDFSKLRIRVYVDGEATASIDMELGLGAGVGFADPAAPWGTKFSGITGAPSGVYLNYRIPFSKKILVTAELPAGVRRETVFWWIVRGVENLPLHISEIQLPESARLRLHKVENLRVAPLQQFDLCRVGGSGMVFLVTMAAKSTNLEFMEGQMRAYMAESKEPQFLSSGLEDYFLGTYYFNRGLYHLPQAGLTHKDESDSSFSAYRFHDIDPIFFAHGIRLACRCGEKRGDKVFGTTGKPMPTTYTTYVWIYEW
jgi:hypothetical protein